MKNKVLKIFKYGIPLVAAIALPSIISSCSAVASTSTKVLDSSNWNSGEAKYTELKSSGISLESSVYGSNYNSGNYIFMYGSLANTEVAKFLYGNNSQGLVEEPNFSTSNFFETYFNSILQNGDLGFTVSFLMYIDIPVYNENAIEAYGETGWESPTDKFTIENVLNEYNEGKSPGKYTEATLPAEAQLKVGNYKRNDESAITYRELVKYVKEIRPSLSSTADSGAIIAFKNGNNPKSFNIDGSIINDLLTYYTPTE
ncbi:MAG: hypothetical protein K2H56_03810 [Malacoplasma sp.]|nr:hypothetical protein [Malacoplasma sp.]MDE5775123.1 hypothetical protein [Malacoplasma sp.]